MILAWYWEDLWFGGSSLAIQYWHIYILANEQNITVADAWDGDQLNTSRNMTIHPELWSRPNYNPGSMHH